MCIAVLAEWSKALDLGSNLSGGAGSNPADCNSLFGSNYFDIFLGVVKFLNIIFFGYVTLSEISFFLCVFYWYF